MDQELNKQLLEDLNKSGFGSEMRAIRQFLRKEWSCKGGSHYFDEDENKNQEIDIEAGKGRVEKCENGRHLLVSSRIVAEVKKAVRPWIVFKRPWNNLTYTRNLPCDDHHLVEPLSQRSLSQVCGWKGYGIHESFKKPNAPSRWYSSFVKACKAVESHLKTHAAVHDKVGPLWHEMTLIKPVVILDGILLSASLSDESAINLEEIDFAPFDFSYRSKASTKDSYLIDVVRLDHLDAYIDLSERRLQALWDSISPFTRL